MSDSSDQYHDQIHVLSVALGEYIAVHDGVFAFSLRRVLPIVPIFKRVDYASHRDALLELEQALVEVERSFGRLALNDLNGQTLRDYTRALLYTVTHLAGICEKLTLKSSGERDYSWKEYSSDHREYTRRVNEYQICGKRVNQFLADHSR